RGPAEDGVARAPQFVGKRREELVLDLVCPLRVPPRAALALQQAGPLDVPVPQALRALPQLLLDLGPLDEVGGHAREEIEVAKLVLRRPVRRGEMIVEQAEQAAVAADQRRGLDGADSVLQQDVQIFGAPELLEL